MIDLDLLAEYNESLDAALIEYMRGNAEPFRLHAEKYDVKVPNNSLTHRTAVMKAVTSRTALPMGMRKKAKRWLTKRGLNPWDDGDV